MARDAGAKNVYFASASPPVRYPNVYGIDMPSASELIAHGRTVEEIQEKIGADWLIYQELDDLIHSATEGNKDIEEFVEQLTTEQFQNMTRFFDTMPKLRHVVEVTNPKTNVKSEVVLEGLQSFLE